MYFVKIFSVALYLAAITDAQKEEEEEEEEEDVLAFTKRFFMGDVYYTADYHEELGQGPTGGEIKRNKNGYKFNYYRIDDSGHHRFDDRREEKGVVLNRGTDNEELVVKGEYGVKYPSGLYVNVVYTADKNGYKPYVFVKQFWEEALPSIACLKNLCG